MLFEIYEISSKDRKHKKRFLICGDNEIDLGTRKLNSTEVRSYVKTLPSNQDILIKEAIYKISLDANGNNLYFEEQTKYEGVCPCEKKFDVVLLDMMEQSDDHKIRVK